MQHGGIVASGRHCHVFPRSCGGNTSASHPLWEVVLAVLLQRAKRQRVGPASAACRGRLQSSRPQRPEAAKPQAVFSPAENGGGEPGRRGIAR